MHQWKYGEGEGEEEVEERRKMERERKKERPAPFNLVLHPPLKARMVGSSCRRALLTA